MELLPIHGLLDLGLPCIRRRRKIRSSWLSSAHGRPVGEALFRIPYELIVEKILTGKAGSQKILLRKRSGFGMTKSCRPAYFSGAEWNISSIAAAAPTVSAKDRTGFIEPEGHGYNVSDFLPGSLSTLLISVRKYCKTIIL
jgi:hypothetical protein